MTTMKERLAIRLHCDGQLDQWEAMPTVLRDSALANAEAVLREMLVGLSEDICEAGRLKHNKLTNGQRGISKLMVAEIVIATIQAAIDE